MRTSLLILFWQVVVLVGCFPGGEKQRTVVGDFRLEQWEDGITYYLNKKGDKGSGGGVLGGTVQRIGWSQRYIVAKRRSTFRGDMDGWMVIDLQSNVITGPFSDAEFSARDESKNIETFESSEAWKRL